MTKKMDGPLFHSRKVMHMTKQDTITTLISQILIVASLRIQLTNLFLSLPLLQNYLLTNTFMLKNKITNINNNLHNKSSIKNPSSTLSHLSDLEWEYQQTKREILRQVMAEPKPIQIRVKAWLDKFQSVVEVELWRKNRNLYSKVMLVMLNKKALTHPFQKLPPSASLPMLSLYEVAFDVRKELEKQDNNNQNISRHDKENDKQNNSCLGNKANIEGALSHHRSKQKYNIQSKVIHRQSQEFADLLQQGLEKQISQTVRSSYDFILKNLQVFSNKEEVNDLLEELWNFSVI